MGGAHYFVLRQGVGRIFVTSLHFTMNFTGKPSHVEMLIRIETATVTF